MKLTVFGGAGEVGGNQILLEGKETKILLDFGRSFSREASYFADPYLTARSAEQLHSLGLLPDLPGLYPWDGREPEISGVLLSHAHLDHMDYVRYLKLEVPLYVGEGTWRIILAREIPSLRPEEYKLAKFLEGPGPLHQCFCSPRGLGNLLTFRTGKKLRIGEFEVEPVHVDHSIPAAYGFVIDGPEGKVVYTGDFRFHGYLPDLTEDFLGEAGDPDILIMEGTNVLESKPSSEKEVKEKIRGIVSQARGLVAASFSSVDVDRLRTFFEVARETGREFVLSRRQGALMDFLGPEIERGLLRFPFKLGDPEVKIYGRGKKTLYNWEKKLLNYETVDSSWVSENQRRVLLFSTYYDMLELLEIEPEPGSLFLYSESEPWDEEGEMEFEKLANWLEHLGLPMFQVHASGHASSLDLRRVVERLEPKHVVMVHSERPELFRRFLGDGRVICPERGKTLELT
jgi:ribonuclease J